MTYRRTDLFDRADDVRHIARWFIVRNARRKRLAMWCQSVEDVVQQVFVDLLNGRDELPVKLTTAVCNQTHWTLCKMVERRTRCFTLCGDCERIAEPWRVRMEREDTPDDRVEPVDYDVLYSALRGLTYREREIIRMRFGLGDGYTYTLEDVGRAFKVAREHVRQIESKAIKKLQDPSRPLHHTLRELL